MKKRKIFEILSKIATFIGIFTVLLWSSALFLINSPEYLSAIINKTETFSQAWEKKAPSVPSSPKKKDSLLEEAIVEINTTAELIQIIKKGYTPKIRNKEIVEIRAKKGDSIANIAKRLGTQPEKILELNKIRDPNFIVPGQKIKVIPYDTINVVKVTWYEDGVLMANGKPFDPNNPTIAAHWYLPFGTKIRLKEIWRGREIVVVIQDRGPHPRFEDRHFDISRAAAEKLGIKKGKRSGWGWCTIEVLEAPKGSG